MEHNVVSGYMKKLKLFFVAAGVLLASLSFNSCLDDDGYSLDDMWLSVVTIRPLGDDSFYLNLDDGTTLFRATQDYYSRYHLTRPIRAQVNFTVLSDNYNGYDHAIKLNRMDTILTKPIAEYLGVEENDKVYGKDPVSVEDKDVWVGDGFLNLIFKFNFTNGSKKHFINLVPVDATGEDPYTLEFRHNAYGDSSSEGGTSIVAFNLSTLPDTGGKDVTLKIKVKTSGGEKIIEKKYNSAKNTEKE